MKQSGPTQPGYGYTSATECRAFLLTLATRHQALLGDALRGIYTDRFFSIHYARKLHEVLVNLALFFESALLQTAGLASGEDCSGVDAQALAALYPVEAGMLKSGDDVAAFVQKCWPCTAGIHVGLAQDAVKWFMEQSISSLIDDDAGRERLMTVLVDPYFATQQKEMTKKLNEIIHFYCTPRGERALSAGNLKRHITSFVDSVTSLIVENILVEGLPTILTHTTIGGLSSRDLLLIAGRSTVQADKIPDRLSRRLQMLHGRTEYSYLPRVLAGHGVRTSVTDSEATGVLTPQSGDPFWSEDLTEGQTPKPDVPCILDSAIPDFLCILDSEVPDIDWVPVEIATMGSDGTKPAKNSASSLTSGEASPGWTHISISSPDTLSPISFGSPSTPRRLKITPMRLLSTRGYSKYCALSDRSPFSELLGSGSRANRTGSVISGATCKFERPPKSDLVISGACYAKSDKFPFPMRMG